MKVSVFLPTIRTHLLEKWYASLEKSCSRHSFEAIFSGPFDIPDSLAKRENVKFIKDFGNPTRAAQLAAIAAEGEYLYHVVDDILFFEDCLSDELDKIEENDIVALRYREGQDFSGTELPLYYWYAPNAYPSWPGINQGWGIGIHFLMKKEIFIEFGGFDCRFEYLNHSTHDLLFRIQKAREVNYKLSSKEASTADWMPGTSGDHGPIHYAQITHDEGLFRSMWFSGNDNLNIDIGNWKDVPEVWSRRFDSTDIKSYEEL